MAERLAVGQYRNAQRVFHASLYYVLAVGGVGAAVAFFGAPFFLSKQPDAVLALLNGSVDCVIIDNEPAKSFVEANEGLMILETAYAEEEYAIAMALENTELLDKINTALEELKAEGKLDEIVSKYIAAE